MHQKRVEDIFELLGTSERGLSRQEAKLRLSRDGPNELDLTAKVSPFSIFLRQFTSPLIWLLGLAVIISLLIDERVDAWLIGIIVLANAIIGFFQEFKAERAIEALQKMASPQAHVLRDGIITKIDSKYVVPGDILILEVGDKVAADARLIEVFNLQTQEAALTGESRPVSKSTKELPEKISVADRKNMVFSGTISQFKPAGLLSSNSRVETSPVSLSVIVSLRPIRRRRRVTFFGVVAAGADVVAVGFRGVEGLRRDEDHVCRPCRQVAADIRKLRPPEPYLGKGIRYQGERVRHKAGKAGKAAKR